MQSCENKVATINKWEQNMDNFFSNARKSNAEEARRLETKETIKDAIGAFAIIAMLYIGLFIPSL